MAMFLWIVAATIVTFLCLTAHHAGMNRRH
jgi:hypothetical protein